MVDFGSGAGAEAAAAAPAEEEMEGTEWSSLYTNTRSLVIKI